VIVEYYKGFRIEVTARHVDSAWDAEVRVRHALSDGKPHVDRVMCHKSTAKAAEDRAVRYARRWVDRSGVRTKPPPEAR
jgi:hypothetical protein